MSTAVITGGAGFIGSNLADALLADGRAVHVVDDLSNGQLRRVPGDAEFHEIDIRDAPSPKRRYAAINSAAVVSSTIG